MTIQSNDISLLSNNYIEKILKGSLPYFFTLVFFTTVVGALLGYIEHNSWKMGDWLINYQSGMIRRGFLGEIIYQLAHFTHINPGLYVIVFQLFFYAIFLSCSFVLLKRQHFLLPYVLLVFSPFIFTFQINDLQGGFRKEIIYFALLAFITCAAKTREHKTFEKIFYVTLLLYPAIILTHEMLAILLPYLLVVYLSVTTLNRRKFIYISLLLIPSVASLIVSIHYSGTTLQVTEIFNSLSRENYALAGGAISWLDRNASFGAGLIVDLVSNSHYVLYYSLFLGLSLIAYFPVYKKIKLIFKNRLSFFLILLSIIGSTALFMVAIDWGRFIYIHLVSLFVLSLIPESRLSRYNEDFLYQSTNLTKISAITFLLLYTMLWHIPHGNPKSLYAKSYKQINIIAFAKPYAKIFIYKFPIFKAYFK